MLKTTILICSLATNPDPSTCSPNSAIDLMTFPPQRGAICGPAGQMTLAKTALKPEPGKSYAKILCESVREARR